MANKARPLKERTFTCDLCSQKPNEAFTTYLDGAFNDWFIFHTDKQLIHLHYGPSAETPEDNIKEAKVVAAFVIESLNNSNKPVYIIADGTQIGDAPFPSSEGLQVYRELFDHPNYVNCLIYGAPRFFRIFLNGWTKVANIKLAMVKDFDTATARYEKWYTEQKVKDIE